MFLIEIEDNDNRLLHVSLTNVLPLPNQMDLESGLKRQQCAYNIRYSGMKCNWEMTTT